PADEFEGAAGAPAPPLARAGAGCAVAAAAPVARASAGDGVAGADAAGVVSGAGVQVDEGAGVGGATAAVAGAGAAVAGAGAAGAQEAASNPKRLTRVTQR